MPEEPNVRSFGFWRARSMSSFTLLTGTFGLTTIKLGSA